MSDSSFALICFNDGAAILPASWITNSEEDECSCYYPNGLTSAQVLSLQKPKLTWSVYNGIILEISS